MLTALAAYLLVGVMLTMIAVETTKQIPKPQLSVMLLAVGAVVIIPYALFYVLVRIFGGNAK